VVVQKGWRRGGHKWFIRLDRNRVAALVNNVHLVDHSWLYQNPRFHPPRPALETRDLRPYNGGPTVTDQLFTATAFGNRLRNSKRPPKPFGRILDVSIGQALQMPFCYAESLQGRECSSNGAGASIHCFFNPRPHTFFDDLVGAKNLGQRKGIEHRNDDR
jgi:hypothetical protein